jgi:hypothetical protein
MGRENNVGPRQEGIAEDEFAQLPDAVGVVRLLREGVTAKMSDDVARNDVRSTLTKNSFILQDVQSSSTDVAALKRIAQGRGFDQCAPRSVDDDHPALRFPQALPVDDVVSLRRQGGVE